MLAILRASVYPSHPVERLKVIMNDASAKVVTASGGYAEFMRQLVPSVVGVMEESYQTPLVSASH
ncbi:hypothetical protein K504DRAFT_509159 [Pleomassaria siparia CBS 279.74]|uniref:Uncharacterized protein n=1 Tax=Pleomassaria siparia CBS 279.74 TaxID=1314801 RepID=A0A6G1KN69_9PLEO|nr:hypothetical protein K504DRAFT_509159 [Pleomassaria siparia CBS 279.74]